MFIDDRPGSAMSLSFARENAAKANDDVAALQRRVDELEAAVRYLMRTDGERLAAINEKRQPRTGIGE